MRRARWLQAIPICFLGMACGSAAEPGDHAYLTVIDSVTRVLRHASRGCFARAFYPAGQDALPAALQDSLLARGWVLHDPTLPIDTGAVMVHIAEARSQEEGLVILAGFSAVDRTGNELAPWGEDWLFHVACEADGCRITGVEERTHWDGAITDATARASDQQRACLGSIPQPKARAPR